MLHQFESQLAASWTPQDWCDTSVLVAVSGGADSVALVRALAAIRAPGEGGLMIAHFNHRLRGPASDADEQFVIELGRRLELDVHLAHREPGSSLSNQRPSPGRQPGDLSRPPSDVSRPPGDSSPSKGGSLENLARAARYDFLQSTAERLGARYVVTAHTADDQAETILHRIVRGTGLAGLAGMQRARPLGPAVSLVRPLLDLRRSDVIEYLAALDQPFCEDHTNADLRFTRNRLRHELLPHLAEQYNPQVREALLRLGSLAAESQQVIDRLVDDLLARSIIRCTAESVELDTDLLSSQPRYLVRELFIALWKRQGWPLQAMGYSEWEQLAAMIQSPSSATSGPTISRAPGVSPGMAPSQQSGSIRSIASASKRIFPGEIVAERRGSRLTLRIPFPED